MFVGRYGSSRSVFVQSPAREASGAGGTATMVSGSALQPSANSVRVPPVTKVAGNRSCRGLAWVVVEVKGGPKPSCRRSR